MIVGKHKTTMIILAEIQYEPVLDKHIGKKEWKEKVVAKKKKKKQAKNKDPMKRSQ